MEPFVQRMLERAKARREKLDTQLSNAGHDVKRRRSPLKDANALLAQGAATSKTPIKSPDKEGGTHNARCKLHRLGKLYSDDSSYLLSSPIHKTEENFSAEDHTEHKPAKRGARLDRFAALASTINNWEDDLSHPILTKPPDNKIERIQAKFNEQVKNVTESQPSTSGCNRYTNQRKSKDTIPVKQIKWDKNVLESLEAQGFSRTESNSRLVYDYKDCSQESKVITKHVSPNKLTNHQQGVERKQISPHKSGMSPRAKQIENVTTFKSPTGSFKSNDSKDSKTPEKAIKNANFSNNSRLSPRFGFNNSPKGSIQSSGSVLSKASMFEAKNMDTKVKDPAQMTLAERMAFFERNKGEAPLIPKAPLTMSIPPKKLQQKNSVPSGSNLVSSPVNNQKVNIPNKPVNVQRTTFEQGGQNIEEIESHILQATHAERHRELDTLRLRFNGNKEIVRAAVGSCIRTSESSEGKSSSPKSSPVCPVKPTPAPDHAPPPPPPPPPLPQPQIISYHMKSSVKRQVVGSPPKVQHSNTLPEIKRVRVCYPKSGSLYPNLSEIEITESEDDTEYTVDSTEPETATLERTESDTATEADYYIQDDDINTSQSDQGSIQANTSFGRTILHELNERSLFNKKRSIEPDPDSTISDISVLNEMDQYLDECLAAEELYTGNTEEGPTPPKVNRAGKSTSTVPRGFNQEFRSPLKAVSSSASPNKSKPYIEDNGSRVPLMRTVSAYRRQQSELSKTPRTATRTAESNLVSGTDKFERENESELIENKVKQLLDEVCTQQKKIEEASKALNLCQSTIEFNGSSEHVGGEWALLIATHKRQAILNEVQRLKREGTLRPVKAGSPEVQGIGSLTISAITLPFRQEFFRNVANDVYLHCICLMRYLGEVVATQAATAEPGDSCLRFTSTLKFDNLYSDFNIAVEIYFLQTQPKYLPHERKYHISQNGINKKNMNRTPKKKSQFVMPNIQSPAGPTVIRSPAFQLFGTTTIDLNNIHREQFSLHKVSSQCPLEGSLRMRISRKLTISVEHRGFLTVFEDISGLGAWDRRWCLLKDARLLYWIHPEDEYKKPAIGNLDLEGIATKNVVFVNREKCARPFTFLLETIRPAQNGDANNLIMKTNGIETKIEHFLLADTREEGLLWLSKLNKTLSLIRAWGLPTNPI